MIEEVAGAVKDLIKAGTVRQFGRSEAAAETIRLQRPAAHARKGRRPLAAEGARGPSDQQADGDVDTAAPDAGSSTGLAAACAWPFWALTGCWIRAPVVVVGATRRIRQQPLLTR